MLTKPSSTNYLGHPMNREPPNLNKNNMKKPRSNPQPGIPPPPPSPPNYMKSTSSFDAKKDSFKTLRKTTSFKSPRASTKKSPSVLINRDTCSSTLKDSKFPAFLELNHGGNQLEGTSVFKVCHYTYCSLNGHHHRHNPPLPPLNRFITSKRRQILKARCQSPTQATTAGDRPGNVDELDIPSTDNDSGMSEEGLETELLKTYETSNSDCLSPPQGIAVDDQPEKVDDLDTPNTEIESELSEAFEMEMEVGPEKEFLETHQTSNPDCLSPAPEIGAGDQLEKVDDLDIPNTDIESEQSEALNVEKSMDEVSGHGQLEENDEVRGIDLDHLKMAKSERRSVEEMDEEQKGFNPKQPNYLDVESEPETEKVDLRHQELDDKKNSEEWMLDYAIQQAVNKLGSVQKKRVGLLVEAFEKVIPTHQFEHRSMSSSPVALNHSRPIIQACI